MSEQQERRRFLGFAASAWQKAGREGGVVLAGQLGVAFAGLFGLRLITGLADRAVFGEATLLTGAIALGRNIFVAPVTNVQVRFHAEYAAAGRLAPFSHSIERYTWRATALFGVAGALAYLLWRTLSAGGYRPLLLGALAMTLVAEGLRTVRLNWLGAERLQGRVSGWLVLEQVLSLGLGAVALVIANAINRFHTELYLAGQSSGLILAALLCGRLWFPQQPDLRSLTVDHSELKIVEKIRDYGVPFITLAIVGWLMNLGDRFAVGSLLNTEAVGSYVAAYSIASRAVMMPQGVLGGFARAIVFQAEGQGLHARAQKVFLLWTAGVVGCSAAVCAVLWLGGPWIGQLMLDPRYRAGAPELMLWVGVGHLLYGVTQVLENRLLSLGISARLIVPSVIGGLTNIGACLVLIPMLDASGAAMAKVIAFGINCALIAVTLGRAGVRQVASR